MWRHPSGRHPCFSSKDLAFDTGSPPCGEKIMLQLEIGIPQNPQACRKPAAQAPLNEHATPKESLNPINPKPLNPKPLTQGELRGPILPNWKPCNLRRVKFQTSVTPGRSSKLVRFGNSLHTGPHVYERYIYIYMYIYSTDS